MRFLLLALLLIPLSYAALNCTIESASTCSSGTKYLGLENETGGGEDNAHVQNYTLDTYANSLCCTTTLSDTLTNSCAAETFARLSSNDNAHIQAANISTYSVDACIGLVATNITCSSVNRTCFTNESCMLSMSDYDNAHAAACGTYDINICCSAANSPPSIPTLITPADNNLSVFERYTFFNWSVSTDPQGDPITYEVNITAPAGCAVLPNYNVSSNNYTSTEQLCVDNNYTWTVRACDNSSLCSAYATPFTFRIASVVGVEFTTNTTDFGTLNPSLPGSNNTDNTSDSSPSPLILNNTGNVPINTSVRALASLWTQQGLNTSYFQFEDENQTSWIDFSNTYQAHTSNLSIGVQRELELLIVVPIGEPGGAKNTTIQALGVSNE